MTAADVVELVRLLSVHSVDVVLDGGWGVDALLERQTRPHADLDIAVAEDQVATLRRVLDERGFRVQGEGAHQPHNFVLVDAVGRRLDIHVAAAARLGSGSRLVRLGVWTAAELDAAT